MLGAIRERIRARVLETVHDGDLRLERFSAPVGDPGLFGPDSPTWLVTALPEGMLTGGFAALMLQSLHPLAMAGVAGFSDFRTDPLGRLNRTARFVTVTVFGSSEEAESALARVRRVHTTVHGTAPDGRPYRADDPDLLTWVHTAEVSCFLAGYQAFAARPLSPAESDRYLAETALLAERLGAREVPRGAAEAAAYLADMRPRLEATPAALEAVRFLRGFGRDPLERIATGILMNGGIGLLPDWARAALGIRRPALVRRCLDRPAARLLGAVLVWACGPSEIAAVARARAAASPAPGPRTAAAPTRGIPSAS
ncbi:MAG TPA: oxygenase MpaB family protein [Actinospica sp.]|nr:oxygenase MpaB family protein [Actinospica sp.]